MYVPSKEELQALELAFDGIKAEDDVALRANFGKVFVDTNAFRLANKNGKCVVVGRKGSGKTALLLGYANKHSKDCFLTTTLSSDDLPFQTLYSYFLRDASDKITEIKKTANDLGHSAPEIIDFIHPTKLSCYAWRMAIIKTAIFFTSRELLRTETLSKSDKFILNRAVKEIKKEVGLGGATQIMPFFFERLVYSYGKISEVIEGALSLAGYDFISLIAKISGRVSTELKSMPKPTIMDAEKVITKLLSHGRNRFTLFTYDRFDDFYDENYSDVLHRDRDLTEGQLSRKQLLASVIEGLILATQEIKVSRQFSWLHMLVTIPMDKFMELELRERARLKKNHVFSLEWKPKELYDFVNKRIKEVLGGKIPMNTEPWRYLFPNQIAHITVEGVKEDSFLYIYRHTHSKPREISMVCSKLFNRMQEGYETESLPQIIRETVDVVTRDIIDNQFIPEFISEYPNLNSFFDQIGDEASKEPVMNYSKLATLISNADVTLSSEDDTCDEIIRRLFEMCVIGIRQILPFKSMSEHSVSQQNVHAAYKFYYNSNNVKIGSGQASDFVVHPLFLEYLSFAPLDKYVINEQKWDMYACNPQN